LPIYPRGVLPGGPRRRAGRPPGEHPPGPALRDHRRVGGQRRGQPRGDQLAVNNDFQILDGAPGDVTVYRDDNSYSYLLPNLDFSIDFTDTLKGRASFSRTIARAPFTSLAAGPGNVNTPTGSILLNESSRASADTQNTKLKPLESNNIDLALEWYFADASYLSATYWNKQVNNFLGTSVERGTMYDLTDPPSGPDAQAALAFLDS